MSTIIAGHFQLQDQIVQARAALSAAGFSEDRISAFFVNPPGQHNLNALGGDHDISGGAKETPAAVLEGVAAGGVLGAAIGAATSVITGPVGPVVGALVGAHVGSLYSFSKMKEAGEGEQGGHNVATPRTTGMLVAVAVDSQTDASRALAVLGELGADHIERAEGSIVAGDWIDFNPASTAVLLS